MSRNKESLVQNILKRSEEIYNILDLAIPPEWLSSDLTVAQLRVLLLLHAAGPSRMSSIASSIGTALSTATGIMDNLVKKGMVLREADPHDRRLVICGLSPEGVELISRLWKMGQAQMERLLEGLTLEQLQKAVEVADFLYSNVCR